MKRALTMTLALTVALGASVVATTAAATPAAAATISTHSVAPTAVKSGTKLATTTALNLRKSHSTGSKVLTILPRGAKVTAKTTSGSWAKVTYKGKTGWAHTDYLKKASSSSKSAASKHTSPAKAKKIAKGLVADRDWSSKQYTCLVKLWNRESGWRVTAGNRSSGAYGIPQALPGSKMKSKGSNWRTSATTQIKWGLSYIDNRYGKPCAALSHSDRTGWY